MRELELIDASNWEDFTKSPMAFLMLAKTSCDFCKAWSEELNAFLATDNEFSQVRFGKIYLDQGGLAEFKRQNHWLKEVDVLPYNMIYFEGNPVKKMIGSGLERLINRLKQVQENSGFHQPR